MSKPKPNKLAAVLKEKAAGVVKTTKQPEATKQAANSKEGRVMVSAWLPIEGRSSFRLIQAKHPQMQMQDLITEAIDMLFAKYKVPQTGGRRSVSKVVESLIDLNRKKLKAEAKNAE